MRALALAYLGVANATDLKLRIVSERHIDRVLAATDHNLSLAAELLGVNRRSLQRRVHRPRASRIVAAHDARRASARSKQARKASASSKREHKARMTPGPSCKSARHTPTNCPACNLKRRTWWATLDERGAALALAACRTTVFQ